MSYKLIAIDIDDTLLNSKRELTERTVLAMRKAEEKGIQVVLCTGRLFISLKRLYDEIGLHSTTICCGGAQIVDPGGKVLYSCPINAEDTHNILELAHEMNAYGHVYIGDNFCYEWHSPYSDYYEGLCGFKGRHVPELRQMKDLTTPKLLMINDADFTKRIEARAKEVFPHLNIGTSKPIFLEFNNPKANKGNSLEMLGNLLNIAPDEMIAVGDNQIDASMIRYAGLGVAVGNALDEIKAIAQYISADNDHDGVGEVIEKFILNNEN